MEIDAETETKEDDFRLTLHYQSSFFFLFFFFPLASFVDRVLCVTLNY
jgi:hypothetical protein